MLVLVLAVETGCPHTWRTGGTIDMMVERQMWENANAWKRPCRMPPEEWNMKCKEYHSEPEQERWKCPDECIPPPPR
jgi:hypothetical protein